MTPRDQAQNRVVALFAEIGEMETDLAKKRDEAQALRGFIQGWDTAEAARAAEAAQAVETKQD